ncbi:DUF6624 domain-containing protein [Ferruginibacter sp. HRS2-29]|uniref:DUF6624 domain-containing protein n=1 Tax=Ferruginibacter sp. HRS2-29 TaxID=2487334 RepID=UPI0020CEB528|nr:DUF6624 domain-containing protein [Ferruginibacter sp. HRS2-29]
MIFFTLVINAAFCQVTSYQFDPNKIDKQLSQTMDSLYREDQRYRLELTKFEKEGRTREQLDSIRSIIKKKDHANLVFAIQWIDKNGWPGPQEVGFQGVQALFLIIQHADLQTQKKYYPIILQAEKDGKMLSSNVAILEDRIAVREGREQKYGSQIYYNAEQKKEYIYPLADLKNLDTLRRSRGLPPMKEYKKDWDVNDYEASLADSKELLARSKELNGNAVP